MYNFVKSVLSKNIYLDIAEKVDNIVKSGLKKVDVETFKTVDFSCLVDFLLRIKNTDWITIDDYLISFDPDNIDAFDNLITYITEFIVVSRDCEKIEYDYIVKNMKLLLENYENLINKIDKYLSSFKFLELNSVDQSILLLFIIESITYKTPKPILIKEATLLASVFSSDSSINLINAILDKVLI